MVAHSVLSRRVSRVNSGGKTMRLSVLVVSGDQQGCVGFGLGKALEYIDAFNKGKKKAEKSLARIRMYQNRTIPHDVNAKFKSSLVYMRKAKPGTGIVAGGVARYVFESLGIKDVVCKVYGKNAINNVHAIFKALKSLKTPSEIAKLRSVFVSDMFYKKEGK